MLTRAQESPLGLARAWSCRRRGRGASACGCQIATHRWAAGRAAGRIRTRRWCFPPVDIITPFLRHPEVLHDIADALKDGPLSQLTKEAVAGTSHRRSGASVARANSGLQSPMAPERGPTALSPPLVPVNSRWQADIGG
jgi:hypothetical protein